jgi:hypothetical protein
MNVHYQKGSLLDYDGVYMAEGPWPGKAYFDAMRQARKRDAGLYMNYGYTRPNVVSRGPVPQGCNDGCQTDGQGGAFDAPGPMPEQAMPADEALPSPAMQQQQRPQQQPQQQQQRTTTPPATNSSSISPGKRGKLLAVSC